MHFKTITIITGFFICSLRNLFSIKYDITGQNFTIYLIYRQAVLFGIVKL